MLRKPVVIREWDVPLVDLPSALVGLRIAHVSDFHFRGWNRTLQAAQDFLAQGEFDLILATGDFGTRLHLWEHAAKQATRFFQPIAEKSPVYAVLGNHDHQDFPSCVDTPITFLRNESVLFERRGASVELLGVEQTGMPPGDLDRTLESPRKAPLSILLAHYPSTIYHLPPGRVDLQLSGHTHGGQIRLPLLGCVWSNDLVPRQIVRGLHRIGQQSLHISPGLGVSPPLPLRVNCPPEVSVLTLMADNSQRSKPLEQVKLATITT